MRRFGATRPWRDHTGRGHTSRGRTWWTTCCDSCDDSRLESIHRARRGSRVCWTGHSLSTWQHASRRPGNVAARQSNLVSFGRYVELSGDPTDYAAASNNALELGDAAAATRLWAMHCAATSMKGAAASGDLLYEPPPAATAADARLAACLLRSAALVSPVAGTVGGACAAAGHSGQNSTKHVGAYRTCATRDMHAARRAVMALRQRVVAASMDASDPWAIGDPVSLLHPLAGGYLALPNVFAQ